MITLYQFSPALGLRCPSPPCLKLETYLRMVELPYQVAANADVLKAPKKKLPYIQDQGRVIPDSNFIISYLKETYGDPLDQHLSAEEKAILLGMRRLMEENLYWATFCSRWVPEETWSVVRKEIFADLPTPLKWLVPKLVRRNALRDMYGQGMGRHSRDEVHEIGMQDVQAISDFLGDKPYLMGDQPTSLDATGYGTLVNLLWASVGSPIQEYGLTLENLGAYCDRMHSRYWTHAPVPEPVTVG